MSKISTLFLAVENLFEAGYCSQFITEELSLKHNCSEDFILNILTQVKENANVASS